MPLSASELHKIKKAPGMEGVLPIFHERWSPRFFAQRDVVPETLAKIFEAARWAPSSSNEQPWRYIVGHRGPGLPDSDTHRKIAESLGGTNRVWAPKAPVLILGCARAQFSSNGKENRFALYDLGAATSFITLQAAALGLATHQMAGYDQQKARTLLAIPEEYVLGSVMALGYQGDPVGTPEEEELVKREIAPRNRKPLSEFVFSAWGEPAKLG